MSFKASEVSLVHHWLVSMRGGEKVFEQICGIYPESPVFTLVANRSNVSTIFWERPVFRTSVLQCFPHAHKIYPKLLPLFGYAISALSIPSHTKLILSSDASVVKGIRKPEGCLHVCYCHSPPRYLWEREEEYLKHSSGLGGVGKAVFKHTARRYRSYDAKAAQNVDHFIANSAFVQERIQKYYNRDSTLIPPPVAVERFDSSQPADDFYLIVSQLTAYKRVDIAIKAFNRLKKRLIVVGTGSEYKALSEMAGENVSLLGHQDDVSVEFLMERCIAFIYPQVEDFGITAVEAQAAGRPVIAYAKGGVMDTVIDGTTGLFFEEQTVESLMDAVKRLESSFRFAPDLCRENAFHYSEEKFSERITKYLDAISHQQAH